MVLVVLVLVFVVPGVVFSLSRRSGLPLHLLPLKPPPGLQKPVPGPPGPPQGLVISPPGTMISHLKVGFLLITRTELIRLGPELVGILPMSLPELSKQLRDQTNSPKHRKN